MNHLKLQKQYFVVIPCMLILVENCCQIIKGIRNMAQMKKFLDQADQQNTFLGEILVAIIIYLVISVTRMIKLMLLLRRVWVMICITDADAGTQFTVIQPFITCLLVCLLVVFVYMPIFSFLFFTFYLISYDVLRYYNICLFLSAKKLTLQVIQISKTML